MKALRIQDGLFLVLHVGPASRIYRQTWTFT
jgi:hypothetical protein